MIQFEAHSLNAFLADFWQQKPLLIRNALPNFQSPVSAEELAGLSLEPEVESRIVIQHAPQQYELRKGPFEEADYAQLPETDWTLLVQGVDRLLPEVHALLSQFDFIPRWRIDDIMISYATEGGNVGPHFDHYDVFLLQAQGQRRWQLTSKDCHTDNYIEGVDLRLMKRFEVEEDMICEPGDILYLPPKWGHHGVGLSNDCMTYSIGYRSYKGLELWDSFGDYLAEHHAFQTLFKDPNWQTANPGEITDGCWQQARQLMLSALEDEQQLKTWFGRFATQLDQTASQMLPEPLHEDESCETEALIEAIRASNGLQKDPVCRFAYAQVAETTLLYINSAQWETQGASDSFIRLLCNQAYLSLESLTPHLDHAGNQALLKDLWQLQFFEFVE